jgi:hypothetical protein
MCWCTLQCAANFGSSGWCFKDNVRQCAQDCVKDDDLSCYTSSACLSITGDYCNWAYDETRNPFVCDPGTTDLIEM